MLERLRRFQVDGFPRAVVRVRPEVAVGVRRPRTAAGLADDVAWAFPGEQLLGHRPGEVLLRAAGISLSSSACTCEACGAFLTQAAGLMMLDSAHHLDGH